MRNPNSTAQTWLTPGTLVGLYRVEQLISSGGFGAVYRVSRSGRQYALKLPLFDELATPESQRTLEQRIIREVVSLMTLSHPNIVRVHAYDRWPEPETGALYLVMDYVEGVPLFEWRRTASPTLRQVVQVFQSLALALDQMHGLGVVHRDLKSSNVLVAPETDKRWTAKWRPTLVDFGLARPAFTTDVTAEYTLVGTEGLWAPEHAAFAESAFAAGGRFHFTPATDLHCLVLLLYEAVTGQRALLTTSRDFGAVLTELPRPPSTVAAAIPESLDAPLLRLLAKSPEERTPTGAKVAEELEVLLATADERWDAALPAFPEPVEEPTRKERRSDPNIPFPKPSPSLFVPSVEDEFRAKSADARAPTPPAVQPSPAEPATAATVSVTPVETGTRTGAPRRRRFAKLLVAAGVALSAGVAAGLWAGRILATQTLTETSSAPSAPANPTGPANERAAQPATRQVGLRGKPATSGTISQRLVAATVGHVRAGTVEAVLREPLMSRGRLVLPTGTKLVGRAQPLPDGGFAVKFDTALRPDGEPRQSMAAGVSAHAQANANPFAPAQCHSSSNSSFCSSRGEPNPESKPPHETEEQSV